MKLLKLASKNGNSALTLKIPGLGNLSKSQKVLELLDYITTFLFLGFAFLLPLSIYFYSEDSFETSSFTFIVVGVIALFFLYLAAIALSANKRITDPYGLFTVLVFALLTTTAAVLVKDPNSANTFGSMGPNAVKGLSGLSVITYILVYYFVILFVKHTKQAKRLIKTISLGFLTMLLIVALSTTLAVPTNLLLVSMMFLVFSIITSKNLKFLNILGVIYVLVYLLQNVSVYTLFRYSFALFIPALFVYIILFLAEKIEFKKDLNKIKTAATNIFGIEDNKVKINLVNISVFVKQVIKFVTLHSFVILALFIAVIINHTPDVLTSFETPFNAIKSSIELISKDFLTLVAGIGSGGTVPAKSQFASIIEGQGLVGVIAYSALFIFGLYSGLKIAFDELQNKKGYTIKSLISTFAVFNLIFLTILSFFGYIGYVLMIIWMLNFSIICTLLTSHIFYSSEEFLKVISLKAIKNKKISLYVRYFLSIFALGAGLFLIYSVLEIVGNLI